MKKALGIFMLCTFPLAGWAQPSAMPVMAPQPQQSAPVMAVDGEPSDVGILSRRWGPSFTPLEIQRPTFKVRGGFFSTPRPVLSFSEAHSPVRFGPGQPVDFFLRSTLNSGDPRSNIFPALDPARFSLYRLALDDDERHLWLTDPRNSFQTPNPGIPLIVRLFGRSSFQLLPNQPLAPGEYALKYNDNTNRGYDLYCFGVDGPPGSQSSEP